MPCKVTELELVRILREVARLDERFHRYTEASAVLASCDPSTEQTIEDVHRAFGQARDGVVEVLNTQIGLEAIRESAV